MEREETVASTAAHARVLAPIAFRFPQASGHLLGKTVTRKRIAEYITAFSALSAMQTGAMSQDRQKQVVHDTA
jgi:hypothetical protein